MTPRVIPTTFAAIAAILALVLALPITSLAEGGQKRPYTEMPDDKFLRLFGEFEFCRTPLLYPKKYIEELKKTVSEDRAKTTADNERIRCESLGGNSAMIASFQGYDMDHKTVSDPAFWNYLDQVRARNGQQ